MHKDKNYISFVAVIDKNILEVKSFITYILHFANTYFIDFELVIVDNNASYRVIEQMRQILHNSGINVSLISLPYQVNKEKAVITGVDAAIGDFVYEFESLDIDYTHDDLLAMYHKSLSGNDIVFLKPDYKASLLERGFYKLLNKYAHGDVNIDLSSVHLISRRGINRVNNINKSIHYRKFIYSNAGLDYTYVEYAANKKKKSAKFNLHNLDHATDLLLMFTGLGKRVALSLSIFFGLFSLISMIYTLVAYFNIKVVHGWTTLMLLLTLSFTGIFVCITIIIKYLNLILLEQQMDTKVISTKQKI